jgi:hypothetical protein
VRYFARILYLAAGIGIAAVITHTFISTHDTFVVFGASVSSTAQLLNSGPSAGVITVNDGNNITLTPNGTIPVTTSFQITDNNGCSEINSSSIRVYLYRSGASSSCLLGTPQNRYCYIVDGFDQFSCAGGSSTTAYATTTFSVWYFADATDSSSSYSGQTWNASVQASDTLGSSTITNGLSGVLLSSMLAVRAASTSINYGEIAKGADTGAVNQLVELLNVGNASFTISVAGNAMTSGANSFPTSSQHFASGTFRYGGTEQQLSSDGLVLSGLSIPPAPGINVWQQTQPLPFTDYSHSSFAYNGYAYVVGGYANGAATSSVLYAPINASGTIGSWQQTQPLPFTDYYHSSFAYNGYAYVVGGIADGADTSSVLYAPINASGTIGSWQQTQPLPFTDYYHSSFAYNGYAYVVGGMVAGGFLASTTLYAPLPSRNVYWGASVPSNAVEGLYQSTLSFTAIFSP